jgi:prolipoprotein diacylglyceryl transferase
MALQIPSPPISGFHVGPAFVHFYGLMYVIGIALAIIITRRRWRAAGGDPGLVADVATWAVPAGIIGGRIYFDITTPADIPPHWWGVFAVWSGGLGIWGGIAAGAAAGVWRVRRTGGSIAVFADAVAPALLVAQAVGRVGNYFNQELFGKPTSLPWGLFVDKPVRPAGYAGFTTFQPTFLYELIFDLALAAALVWLGHHRRIKPPGLFALYVAGYSAFRMFEESLRIDPSVHFLGLRLNFFVAAVLTVAGITWFVITQRRGTGPPAGREAGEAAAGGTSGEPGAAPGQAGSGATPSQAGSGAAPGSTAPAATAPSATAPSATANSATANSAASPEAAPS